MSTQQATEIVPVPVETGTIGCGNCGRNNKALECPSCLRIFCLECVKHSQTGDVVTKTEIRQVESFIFCPHCGAKLVGSRDGV